MQRIDSDTFTFPGCVVKRGAVGKPDIATVIWSRESDHKEVDIVVTCELVFTDSEFQLTVSEVAGDERGAAEFLKFAQEDGFSDYADPTTTDGMVAAHLIDLGKNLAAANWLSERYEDTDCLLAKVLPCAS